MFVCVCVCVCVCERARDRERGTTWTFPLIILPIIWYFHDWYTLSQQCNGSMSSQSSPVALMAISHTDPGIGSSERKGQPYSCVSPFRQTKSFPAFCRQIRNRQRGKFLFLSVAAPGPPPLTLLGCHRCYCCWKICLRHYLWSQVAPGPRLTGSSPPPLFCPPKIPPVHWGDILLNWNMLKAVSVRNCWADGSLILSAAAS